MKPTNTNNPLNSGRSSRVSFLHPASKEEEALESFRGVLREIKQSDIEISLSPTLTPLAPQNSAIVTQKSEDRIQAEAEEAERQAQAEKTRGAISSQRVKPPRPPIYDPVRAGYKKQRKDIEREQKENSFYAKTKKAFSSFQNGFMKFADTIAKSFGFETYTEKSLRKKSEEDKKDKKTVNKGLLRVQTQDKTEPPKEYTSVFPTKLRKDLQEVVFRNSPLEPKTPEQINREKFKSLLRSHQARIDEQNNSSGGRNTTR